MALWQFTVQPRSDRPDPVGRKTCDLLADLGVTSVRSARLFLIDLPAGGGAVAGPSSSEAGSGDGVSEKRTAERIARELLTDPVTEAYTLQRQGEVSEVDPDGRIVEVHFKPGVMDTVAESTVTALAHMGIAATSVRTARRLTLSPPPSTSIRSELARRLGNGCIEDIVFSPRPLAAAPAPPQYRFALRHVPIRDLDDAALDRLSRDGHLFLSRDEMQAIQAHYRAAGHEPTDLELETLAQTWSEHCVHKTLKSAIVYRGAPMPTMTPPNGDSTSGESRSTVEIRYDNLLKDTIAKATDDLMRERRGPICLSVFKDNAGIIAFDDDYGIAVKVETHNHPSAIEPYGGAATGVGGVIRDVLGCGLGAKPIANTDVFCVAPPNWPNDAVPRGVIHPRAVLRGVVAGVRDYGNCMGIPTVNGAVHFDPRYLGNPLVYCGCIGLIPRDRIDKAARPGDAIVVLGGRTGRDGIHGATFSSAELTDTHADEFSHAVQIGNPLEEKKVLDVVLLARGGDKTSKRQNVETSKGESRKPKAESQNDARDRRGPDATLHGNGCVSNDPTPDPRPLTPDPCLFSAITDCGAGGLSSAIGEMAEHTGAVVDLDRVPLKYAGLRYDEIWISEAQERMVLAVPPENVAAFLALAKSEDVEATVIGRFSEDRRLVVRYQGTVVGDLDMALLHDGLPKTTRVAEWNENVKTSKSQNVETSKNQSSVAAPIQNPNSKIQNSDFALSSLAPDQLLAALRDRLSSPSTASKHWIIRQYDHEVQGRSVIKPLVGPGAGPSDAAVIRPRLDSPRGLAIGCGLAPDLFDVDPYWMAVAVIDEAVRNVVCVGGDPNRIAILDNFCWPRVDNPRNLGALVRACQACHDVALAYGIPFISGKDSLNNEFALDADDIAKVRSAVERLETSKRQNVEMSKEESQKQKTESRNGGGTQSGSGHAATGEPRDSSTLTPDPRSLTPLSNFLRDGRIAIPGTLLITAVALIDDVRQCVTMDAKAGESHLILLGKPMAWPGTGHSGLPPFDATVALRTHQAVARLIRVGAVRAVHDVSDGGILGAAAEMALAGQVGLDLRVSDEWWRSVGGPFHPMPAMYLVEVPAGKEALNRYSAALGDGQNFDQPFGRFRPDSLDLTLSTRTEPPSVLAGISLADLRTAWTETLDW